MKLCKLSDISLQLSYCSFIELFPITLLKTKLPSRMGPNMKIEKLGYPEIYIWHTNKMVYTFQ